jgi:hypothetical protein
MSNDTTPGRMKTGARNSNWNGALRDGEKVADLSPMKNDLDAIATERCADRTGPESLAPRRT